MKKLMIDLDKGEIFINDKKVEYPVVVRLPIKTSPQWHRGLLMNATKNAYEKGKLPKISVEVENLDSL